MKQLRVEDLGDNRKVVLWVCEAVAKEYKEQLKRAQLEVDRLTEIIRFDEIHLN